MVCTALPQRHAELIALLGGPPIPGRINPFDMPDDFFRIRLVATLLETCGIFFNRGAAGKKLDYFLSFVQVSPNPTLSQPFLTDLSSTTSTPRTLSQWISSSSSKTFSP